MKYPIYTLRDGEPDGGGGGGDPAGGGTIAANNSSGGGGDPAVGGQPAGGGGVVAPSFHKEFISEDGKINQNSFANMPEHLKEAIPYISQYKTFEDFLTGAWATKQHVGKNGLEKLPEGASDELKAAQREQINAVLDIPAAPEAYQLARPETFPEEHWNNDNMNAMAKVFHDNSLTTEQANNVLTEYSKIQQGMLDEVNAVQQTAKEDAIASLTKEFGPVNSTTHQKAIDDAYQAGQLVGIDLNDPRFGNSDVIIKALNKVKSFLSEDVFVSGASGDNTSSLSSGVEAEKIMTDSSHPLYAKYHAGDKAVRAQVHALIDDSQKKD